jgi:hypothetical protein
LDFFNQKFSCQGLFKNEKKIHVEEKKGLKGEFSDHFGKLLFSNSNYIFFGQELLFFVSFKCQRMTETISF